MPVFSPPTRSRSSHPLLAAFALAGLMAAGPARAQNWVPVTDGTSGAGLTKFGNGTVEYGAGTGIIKVSGGNGYLRTNSEYNHYRTRIEWNNNGGGNSGFLFHVLQDAIWPLGLECQMHSDDVGSLWTTGCKFNSTGSGSTFNPGGNPITGFGTTGTNRNHFIRSQNPGAAVGTWNTWEMYVNGDSLEIKCNDKLVMRAWRITINDGTPLVRGRIGLQIEGATVQWRNWMIQDLNQPTRIAMPARGPSESTGRPRLFMDPAGSGLSMTASAGIPDVQGSVPSRFADLNGRLLRILPVTYK